MRLWISCLLLCLVFGSLNAGWGRSSSSRSSSSRSSSSSSRSSSGWARPSSSSSSSSRSRGSSSSSSRPSLGSRIRNVFTRRTTARPSGWATARPSGSSSGSSYPTQQWGQGRPGTSSSTGTRTVSSGGSSGGIGGQAQPRPTGTNFGGNYGSNTGQSTGGFSQPRPGGVQPTHTGSAGGGGFITPGSHASPGGGSFGTQGSHGQNVGGGGFITPQSGSRGSNMGTVGAGVAGAGIGGIAGGLAGSSLGNRQGSFGSNTAGGFGSHSNTGFGSHSNTGFGSHSNTGFGSHSNTGFGSHSNTGFGSHSNTGFGGFGSHTQSSHSGSRSGLGGMLGAGAAGAMGGGLLGGGLSHVLRPNRYGTNQYQSFSKPSLGQRLGQRLFGSSRKPYGYNTPGHGTSFGTNFAGGVGRFKPSGGISKKMLGLGVGAGFLGGAALGVAGTMASYSVYHKYQEFKRRMHMLRPSFGFNEEYYRDNYQRNECQYGCPFNSHCEWGFCECNAGTTRRYGQCQADWSSVPNFTPRPTTFDPFQPCSSTSTCATMDMNLICNTALTTGQGGRCECRQDMKWNEQEGECQMYLDVDCSQFTYDTPPSANILSAVSRAQANMETNPVDIVDASAEGRTQTYQESLQNSLLQQMDTTQSTEADLREAFCRDIDAYSFEMEPRALPGPNLPGPTTRSSVQVQLMTVRPTLPPMQQAIGKPPRCEHVPRTACAVAYDSHNCDGGWRLVIPVGEMRFRWFTSTYTYRNDIDTIGVRAGCVFTGYSDSSYNGNRMTMRADSQDRWSVLADEPAFQHMDEDIESVQCTCPNMG